MDYQKVYDNIIQNRLLNPITKNKEEYTEVHHIVPKCLGGSNDKSNFVRLKIREHYICHLLLCKIFENKEKTKENIKSYNKLLSAFACMNDAWGFFKENKRNFNSRLHKKYVELGREKSIQKIKEYRRNLSKEERQIYKEKSRNGLIEYYKTHESMWKNRKHKEETIIKMKKHKETYHPQKGSKNSQYGKIWIHNDELQHSISVYKSVLQEYLDNGWVQGRVIDWNSYKEKQLAKENSISLKKYYDEKKKKGMTIEQIIEIKKSKEERYNKNKELYTMYYKEYIINGYKGVVEKYGYNKSKTNLVNQFHRYIPEYKPLK